jgi:hypothetical protein
MYLAIKKYCPNDTLFYMPHKLEPMTAKKIIKRYPKFAEIFDGTSIENTLTFYYKKNKMSGEYEFIDEEAEEEVAELLGVKVKNFLLKNEEENENGELLNKGTLNDEQLAELQEHRADIKRGLEFLKNDNTVNVFDYSSDVSDSSDVTSIA